MRQLSLFFVTLFILGKITPLSSQTKTPGDTKTKLVVGIVVDQMRNDYIYRYWDRFGAGGFKRLINEGYYFKNAHYNYIPTYTAPGHCSIYTGATPRTHGIIANDWYNKNNSTIQYCVSDTSVRSVGSNSTSGQMSPHNQLSSTIGDELIMSSNKRSKVFGIALKDRSAILPAGHAANAAFWYDDASGNFISSTWYMKELPIWLTNFNDKKLPASYLQKGWSTLYPIESYTNSIADENNYEAAPNKKEKAVFPYEYKSYLNKNSFGVLKMTPFGNTITKELSLECLRSEKLGKDNDCDLLCISFSSPDYIGHYYGPRAIETEDIYLRLDKELEDLLNALDKEVGKNNYTVFLTADHGGADVPAHLLDSKIPAGYLKESKVTKEVKSYFKSTYGDTLLLANISNEQVFLNEEKLRELKLDKNKVETDLCAFLISLKGIAEAYPSSVLRNEAFAQNNLPSLLQNGYNHKLSGHVSFVYQAAWMDYSEKGTTHGAGYNYDTHVPIIFYGNGIKKGLNFNYITITQIAPTVCELLQINQTNSCISEPLNPYFR